MKRMLLEGPAVEPVLLAEAKAHLRLDGDAEDDLVGALIAAARVAVETEIRRVLIAQTWRADRRRLAARRLCAAGRAGALGRGGARDRRRRRGDRSSTRRTTSSIRPTARVRLLDPVAGAVRYEIDFTAGYGASGLDVPQPLRQAIRLLVTHWYENRSAVVARRRSGGDAARLSRAGRALPEDGAVLSRRGASEAGRLRLRLMLEKRDADAGRRRRLDARLGRGRRRVAADVAPVRGGRARGGRGLADLTLHRIVIRHRGDVETGDRFRLGERTVPHQERHRPGRGRALSRLPGGRGGAAMSAARALQEAVFAALTADAELEALLGGANVFDGAPRNAAAPYVHLGEIVARDWSTATEAGAEIVVRGGRAGRGCRGGRRGLRSPSGWARCCMMRR